MYSTALTLISNSTQPALTPTITRTVSAFLARWARAEIDVRVLSAGRSVDFLFTPDDDDCTLLAAELSDLLSLHPVDYGVQPVAGRRKKLLIADMDSTIIDQECIDELAAEIGKRDEISAITERAMHGALDFEDALNTRVAMLTGLHERALQATFDKRITLTTGAGALVKTMNAHGAMTALVSGGFTFFTERVAAATGFQRHRANGLNIAHGVLTGTVHPPILGRAEKEDALIDLCTELSIDTADTLAVGDGANDLAMIGRAGLGVAFCAKPAVASAADVAITHRDLTGLLYLQGYCDAEIDKALK